MKPTATAGMLEAVVSPKQEPSTAGVGFGVAQASRPRGLRELIGLEGVMQTPEEVLVMRQLLERGWNRRRIAAEMGISRNTLNRYLAIGDWQPYSSGNRSSQLDAHQEWLQQQFKQHHGNAEVVRQELVKQKGIAVSLRTVERAVRTWREALRQSRQATVRYETPPGKQLQADFGELWVPIGGLRTKVQICVLTLGYSRRQVVRVYRHQRQRHWLQALEEAFRFWGGIPEQVLVDNAKALITNHNPRTGELVINPVFAAVARHWGFTPKACWPHQPQTKGKDERGVRYVKRVGNSFGEAFGYAGHHGRAAAGALPAGRGGGADGAERQALVSGRAGVQPPCRQGLLRSAGGQPVQRAGGLGGPECHVAGPRSAGGDPPGWPNRDAPHPPGGKPAIPCPATIR
jgi:transposase